MGTGVLVVIEQIEGLKLWVRRPVASPEVPVRVQNKEKAGWTS